MNILKFGGTSVGSVDRIKNVAGLIQDQTPCIVVLSAMSGTTDKLVETGRLLSEGEKEQAEKIIASLEEKYNEVVQDLYYTKEIKEEARLLINEKFQELRSYKDEEVSGKEEKEILAQGEMISTHLFYFHLKEKEVQSKLIPALEFMRLNKDDEPDNEYIEQNIPPYLEAGYETAIFITQGYICRNARGEVDNLKRGGSDYTATLIGAAIKADEVQIWTDIDGVHNNDPRYVKDTQPVTRLSFDEAAELAYFGAKVLHPTSVHPCIRENIPVRMKNTLNPQAEGTLISKESGSEKIKAIAAKDGITAIRIKSDRMLLAYGFLRRIFEIFEKYRTPIDMITTSEVSVSLSIDNPEYLDPIGKELNPIASLEIDRDQSIVCIVGDLIAEKKKEAVRIFQALEDVPVRMISYGGSRHNISILIPSEYKKQALAELSKHLF